MSFTLVINLNLIVITSKEQTLCKIIFYNDLTGKKCNSSIVGGKTRGLAFIPHPESDKCGKFFGSCYLYWGALLFPKLRNTGLITADFRNSHRRCFIKNVALKSFAICTGKHLSRNLFNKVADLEPYLKEAPT